MTIGMFLSAAAGVLAGLAISWFLHRARYRAWTFQRDLLKAQIDDIESQLDARDSEVDISFDEIVESALRNRAMGVEPIGLAAYLIERRERGISGIDRASNPFWVNATAEPVTYGDLVPPIGDECKCKSCRDRRETGKFRSIPGGK